jgi:hypothetical protein
MIPKNRRGTIAMYFTVAGVLLAFGVFLYYSSHTDKYIVNFGMEQNRILKTYQEGEKLLLYVDQAAKLSMQQAAYELARKGFYSNEEFESLSKKSVAGEQFVYWRNARAKLNNEKDDCVVGTTSNYPDEQNIASYFWSFFQDPFSKGINAYNKKRGDEAAIPNDYEGFSVDSENGKTVMAATASEPIVIENKPITYKVKPSFRQSIDLDLLSDLKTLKDRIIGKSKEEIKSYDWDIKGSSHNAECVIISETSDEAATCCWKYQESCDEESKDAEGRCPCEEYGKEKVYRPYTKYDYAVSADSGKRFFIVVGEDVKNTQVTYKFALGWVELGSTRNVCVKVD